MTRYKDTVSLWEILEYLEVIKSEVVSNPSSQNELNSKCNPKIDNESKKENNPFSISELSGKSNPVYINESAKTNNPKNLSEQEGL